MPGMLNWIWLSVGRSSRWVCGGSHCVQFAASSSRSDTFGPLCVPNLHEERTIHDEEELEAHISLMHIYYILLENCRYSHMRRREECHPSQML